MSSKTNDSLLSGSKDENDDEENMSVTDDNNDDVDNEDDGENISEDDDEKDDAPTIDEIELSKKETYYYKIIDKFYKTLNPQKVNLMIDIIEGRSAISLRLLDWFVTRYSNKHKVRYTRIEKDNNDKFEQSIDDGFNVHISYKAQLKSYKKRYFDPFRRRKKFKYFFDKQKNIYLCTTIGQLNFFKWAFNNYVIEYVMSKYKTITKAMGASNKLDKTRKQKALKISMKNDEKEIKNEKDTKEIKEVKIVKDGIKISAQKKETPDEIKIVLSFD